MEQEKEDVYKVTARILAKLKAQEESSSGKAALAALRHSIGKPLGAATDIWPLILENMPEEFLSHNGKETKEECAVYAALQLYAVQRQGTRGRFAAEAVQNIGEALQKIRKGAGQESLDRRFVATISATSFTALVYQLRQLMKLAKARGALPVNFAALAKDFYWYQMGAREKICLRWAEAYYKMDKDKKVESVSK